MKGILVLLFVAACTCATNTLTAQNKTLSTTQQETKDYNRIPAYGMNSDIIELFGKNYPAAQSTSQSMSLLREQMIADGKNQFSRIHAELQKNNEAPTVIDKTTVTPVSPIIPGYSTIASTLNTLEKSLSSQTTPKYSIASSSPINIKPYTATTYTAPAAIPSTDVSQVRTALKEHQLNTEVQLHRLMHAMDMISESIYDPLRDQYQQGVNEMLDSYLNNPEMNRQSPLYRHIAREHAFFEQPDFGERVAQTAYKQVEQQNNEKAQLRQKTVENSRVRAL